MQTNRERGQWNGLILAVGLLLGAYARLLPAILTGFPVTDGGLFYAMVQALKANNYGLPFSVAYNGLQVPFAYPPLGFYLAGLVSDPGGPALLDVFRWLPALLSIACTLAFLPLATSILGSASKGSLATVLYALLPRSISWYVMGGGITRSLGQLFLLLALYAAHRMYLAPARRYVWMTALFGAGAILSHPEAGPHTIALGFILWLFLGRTQAGLRDTLLAGVGLTALVAPWLLLMLIRFGPAPYLSAAQTSFSSWLAWLYLLTGGFADEKFITLVSALALLGSIAAWRERRFPLFAWLVVPALIDPRGGASVSIIAWSMLAALGFADVIVPGLARGVEGPEQERPDLAGALARSRVVQTAVAGLIFYTFVGTVLYDQVYPKLSLGAADREAMDWIAEQIPAGSAFVVVTGQSEAFADARSEWFPILADSISLATIQGREWIEGGGFHARLDDYNRLQQCIAGNAACLDEWSARSGEAFEYVYVSASASSGGNGKVLVDSLLASPGYQLVHRAGEVYIFQRR